MRSSYEGTVGEQTFAYDSDAGAYVYAGELTDSSSDDLVAYVYIELYPYYGAFADGEPTKGTYTIADDDASYDTCGLCVFILGVADDDADISTPTYNLATSGTVRITEFGSSFAATLTNLELEHVEVDSTGTVAAADGCVTSLDSASLDTVLDAESLTCDLATIFAVRNAPL